MAVDHQPSTFAKFPLLPTELREMIFEQALFELLEPRIVIVGKDINDLAGYNDLYNAAFEHNFCSFFVLNRPFLLANDPADTLSQVCKESHRVVLSFHRRFDISGPQPVFESPHLNQLSLGAPLRPQGPHADIFFWEGFTMRENTEHPFAGPANSDVGLAKRWLVPIHLLMENLYFIRAPRVHGFRTRPALLQSPHDIIALTSDPDRTGSLKYSDLVIVSAEASCHVAIPGLDNKDRDFILETFRETFRELKKFYERYERGRQKQHNGKLPTKIGPDLYFAYVNPLKRSEPPQLTQE